MATNSTVTIIPGRAATLATALRGHLSTTLAYMRTGDSDLMEESIIAMRRDLTRFENEVRKVVSNG